MSHDPSVKGAVMAALLAGQGVNSVSEEFGLPKGTVSGWKKEYEQNRTEKVPTRASLIENYLTQNLTTLGAQQEFFRDTSWLREQAASELAVLHGVSADKAIKILEAIERAESMSSPTDSEAETVP